MSGQLLSDLLNEEKICQLFQDEDEQPESRKQEISLNFTVTSRQNNDLINSNKMKIGSDSFFQQAKTSLGQFQNWCTKKLDHQNKQLIDKFSEIGQLTQKKKPTLLSMPPLHLLRESREQKQNKRKSIKQNCQKCKEKDEVIMNLQSSIKELEGQIEKQSILEVKQQILEAVELNLLREKNQEMKLQIYLLKENIEKTNLQKSTLFDKTKDLEKRLGCLQKSFSNAKNSTNPTNANDTLNRENSIISFDNFEINIEEQVRFLQRLRDKYLNLLNEDVKETSVNSSVNVSKQEQMNIRKKSPYYPIYSYGRSIVQKLRAIKKPIIYHHHSNDSDNSFKQNSENRSLHNKIASLEKNIENLRKSYHQLKILYEESLKKNQQAQKIKQSFMEFEQQCEDKIKKIKNSARRMIAQEKNKMMGYIKKIEEEKLQLTYELQDLKGSIRIYCRVRPRIGNQKKNPSILQTTTSSVLKENKKFQFSHVFNEDSTQFQIFKETSRLVECAFEGRNLCIFAYGQTGSGKTYTLHGTHVQPGLAPNIIQQVFNLVDTNKELYHFNISMGMIEIYLENLYDLYGIVPPGTKIEIKEDKNTGIFLENCPLITFNSMQQMMKVYSEGIEKRKKRQTEKNQESSRSHSITIINIFKENIKTKQTIHSKITLIDLAGAQKHSSSNPMIVKETNFINSSLSNLATVFSAMKNKEHVPYRNCKLTHILKDSLTSKGKILMFVNVSPAESSTIETERSLEFGRRVQKVERNEEGENYKKVERQKSRRGSTKLSLG